MQYELGFNIRAQSTVVDLALVPEVFTPSSFLRQFKHVQA